MVSSAVIVNKYAQAAFNIAKKDGLVKKFTEDLRTFSDNFSPQISKELSNPAISKAVLIEVIENLADRLSLGNKIKSFLAVIAEARRITLIKQIYLNFVKLSKIDQNILEVELFVTTQLEKDHLEKIKTLLQKKYHKHTIEIKQTIKKSVLGGLMIKIGSQIIDATVKNQLITIMNQCNSII